MVGLTPLPGHLPTIRERLGDEIQFSRVAAMLDKKIKNELTDIVGPENFTEAKIDMVSYAYDAMGSKGTPDCAVWVTT
ncbi:MAG: hypothetical protein HQ561_17195, partial [Desulfobacteraceae bacterium]|nr:hypothetical protein [Desulfobacteraceae bacterium]